MSLAISRDEAIDILNSQGKIKLRSAKQISVLSLLCENGDQPLKEIYKDTDATRAHVDGLIKKGLVREEKVLTTRDPYAASKIVEKERLILSKEQRDAYDQLEALYATGEARGALLYGITGSGKTSVIKEMIDRVIADSRSVIILVPEISLTPQEEMKAPATIGLLDGCKRQNRGYYGYDLRG